MVIKKEEHREDSCHCYYNLILMDCNMPLMDGFTATKILRAKFRDKKRIPIRIIACTGGLTEEEQKRSIKTGFDSVLAKPVKTANLRAILASVFKTKDRGVGQAEHVGQVEERSKRYRGDGTRASTHTGIQTIRGRSLEHV